MDAVEGWVIGAQMKALKQDAANAWATVDNYKRAIRQWEEALESSREKVAQLEEVVQHRDEAIKDLLGEVAQQREAIKKLLPDVTKQHGIVKYQQDALAKSEANIESLRAALAEKNRVLEQRSREIGRLQQRSDHLTKKLKEMNSALESEKLTRDRWNKVARHLYERHIETACRGVPEHQSRAIIDQAINEVGRFFQLAPAAMLHESASPTGEDGLNHASNGGAESRATVGASRV